MKILFYLSSIVFLFKELQWILHPKQEVEKTKKKEELNKSMRGLKYDNFTQEQKTHLVSILFLLFFIFGWLFIGLFTFQWQLFLAFFVFQIVAIGPISKILKYSFAYMMLHWLNSILGLAFILFVIINSYHLKIDIDFIKYFR